MKPNQKKNIGKKIATARKQAHLTRREVILSMRDKGYDLTEYTLFKWEKGATVPSADRLPALADALKVDAGYFFDL